MGRCGAMNVSCGGMRIAGTNQSYIEYETVD